MIGCLKNPTSKFNPTRNEERKQRKTFGEMSENSKTSVKYNAKRARRAKLVIYF
jgi:hypothetical protein